MMKVVVLTCVAFLVAGVVSILGLYLTDNVGVAVGGFVAAVLLQIIVIWNWQNGDSGGPPG